MKILNLTLKAQWYDMIESGEKKEEYREIKAYWIKRLVKTPTHVRFRYGYTNRSMLFEIINVTINNGKPKWGAEEGKKYFVIKLGKRIE